MGNRHMQIRTHSLKRKVKLKNLLKTKLKI